MTLQFLADATHGVGKKMCACNLGCQAILSSQTALFVIAGQLLGDLAAPDSDSALRSKLRRCAATPRPTYCLSTRSATCPARTFTPTCFSSS